jgi:hypothetical protein
MHGPVKRSLRNHQVFPGFIAQGIAHAVTVWSDGPGGVVITDSDDGVVGPVTDQWVDNNTINYGGTNVTVVYLSMLQDAPEPSTIITFSVGLVATGSPAWPSVAENWPLRHDALSPAIW